MPLVLQASLVGRAQTNSEQGHVQVTLKIADQFLSLKLLPEQAQMFPELVTTQPHPTERRQQVTTYKTAPSYTVTVAEVELELQPSEAIGDETKPGEEDGALEGEPVNADQG
jgi:hypothetical protein